MKKFIFLLTLIFNMAGCFSGTTPPNYQGMSFPRLEEKAQNGELGALFWLADRYFTGNGVNKNENNAQVLLNKLFTELKHNPTSLNSSWFREAYNLQHPVALFLRTTFDLKPYSSEESNEFESEKINEIGKNLDLLFETRENSSIYSPLAKQMLAAFQQAGVGKFCLQVGKEYQTRNNGEAAAPWFNRSCQFNEFEGCKSLLGQW